MNLLTEYITLKQKEKELGFSLPQPTYLFIEHYGRSLEEDLPQLADAFEAADYFCFSSDELTTDSKPYMSFFSTLQKHAPTGQTFQGCILISLSERMQAEDFNAIIALIKNSDGIIPIFTQKSGADIRHLLPALRNNFFLRTVEGEPYQTDELFRIVEAELLRYRLPALSDEATALLSEALGTSNWQPSDDVRHTLKTIIQNLSYDKLIHHEEYTLTAKDIHKYFTLQPLAKKSFPIGFAHN